MNRRDLSKIAKDVKNIAIQHSPEILTGIGVAGMITTTFLAVKATPKALILIREAEFEKDRDLSSTEKIRACWRPYIPAIITGTVSTTCLIGASSVSLRRNAALATAYTLSETALKEYRAKVVETIGEKKESAVRDAIAKDKIEQNPVTTKEVIFTEKGGTLCYDVISGRYFKSDIEQLRRVANELNRRMIDEMYISVNDMYYELGLPLISSSIGDDIGWNVDRGLIEFNFSSQLADDGTPCLVVDYSVVPRYNYR